MTSPVYWAGCEDIDFDYFGSGLATSQAHGTYVDTTAGRFRSGYARYAITFLSNNDSDYSRAVNRGSLGSLTSFFFSARVWCNNGGNPNGLTSYPLRFLDANGVVRIRIKNVSTNFSGLQGPFTIEKVTAAGAATTLGAFTAGTGFSNAPATADKLDLNMNYGTSGRIIVKINNAVVCDTGSVDTTTDGNTSLSQFVISSVSSNSGGITNFFTAWSEIIMANTDLSAFSLVTQAGTANGNTHNWTTANLSNINPNAATYTAVDNSQSAGQIDEYQVTPAIPAGSFGVLSVVQHASMAAGSGGPQHAELMVRTGGTDYTSGTLTLGSSWALVTNNWDTNPNTTNGWQTTELVNSSTLFNMGVQSVA